MLLRQHQIWFTIQINIKRILAVAVSRLLLLANQAKKRYLKVFDTTQLCDCFSYISSLYNVIVIIIVTFYININKAPEYSQGSVSYIKRLTKLRFQQVHFFNFLLNLTKHGYITLFFFFKFSHQPNKALILLELQTVSIVQNHFKKEKNSKAKELGYHNKDCTTIVT